MKNVDERGTARVEDGILNTLQKRHSNWRCTSQVSKVNTEMNIKQRMQGCKDFQRTKSRDVEGQGIREEQLQIRGIIATSSVRTTNSYAP